MRAPAGFGRIERWDDARGFGFIVPETSADGAPDRLFVHIRDIERGATRPVVGARVRYVPERQADGRWRAVRVAAVGAASGARAAPRKRDPARSPSGAKARLWWLAMAAWIGLLAFAAVAGRLPPVAFAVLAGLNALTFGGYAVDKHAAQRGRWRTPESQLHLLELLGGWPAAGLAQQVLRHKRAKPAYRRVFVAMIALHLLALALWTFA